MSTRIRAPKAKKVNSYNINAYSDKRSFHDKGETPSTPFRGDDRNSARVLVLGKMNSEENLRKNAFFELIKNEEVCFEGFESEIEEQMKKLSVVSEINQIFSQPTKRFLLDEFNHISNFGEIRDFKVNPIERCENPFKKNFEKKI